MMKLKESVLLLIVNMGKISYLLIIGFLVSCTSNTIFEKPKNLIPKDTMSLLIQDMMIASSAKYLKNKGNQRNITYMAFIYDIYKIDSLRFKESNFYYISKIDLYEEIINDAKLQLEKKKKYYKKISNNLDSIRNDSIKKSKVLLESKKLLQDNFVLKDEIVTDSIWYNFYKLF